MAKHPTDGHVDSNYTITGDPQAAPVQVFSLGGKLYIQLRNTRIVPAPFAPNGMPLKYTIYGPYMVIANVPKVTLKYGRWQAYIASGQVTTSATVSSTTTRPVDAAHPTTIRQGAPKPSLKASDYETVDASSAASDEVTGTISAGTAAMGVATAAQGGSGASPAKRIVSISAAGSALDAPIVARVKASRGAVLTVYGDDTVSGAIAVRTVINGCKTKGLRCQAVYHGAPAGKLVLEVNS